MATVRLGVLGSGGMAGSHARGLQGNTDAEIVAVCDVNDEITAAFIEKNIAADAKRPAQYTDPATMYAEANLDGVLIVTPHTLHYQHGVQALEAGCHVFMEKPMVTSSDDARKLAAKVKECGKVFAVGFNTPCTAAFQYLRKQIRTETWGKLELVNGYLSQNWMTATAGSWRQKPELSGGGQAYDSGAHILNSLVWSVESPIAEVFSFVDNHGTPVDINSVMAVKFQNGVLASLMVSGNCISAGSHMVFIFEQARVEIDGWNGSFIKVYTGDGDVTPELPDSQENAIQNFVNATLGHGQPNTSPENGIHHSGLMDAIYESAKTGQAVRA